MIINPLHDAHCRDSSQIETKGYCRRCGCEHRLGTGTSVTHARNLMYQLDTSSSIDLFTPELRRDPRCTTDSLFGPARGKMFGVLECMTPGGDVTVLHAFSGQYNGRWQVSGWVPPLFDPGAFQLLTVEKEKEIKQLGRDIDAAEGRSEEWLALRKRRRQLSRALMRKIHGLYSVTNFRGQTISLQEAYIGSGNMPTGTGDCCAPKLLNYAAQHQLQPLGLCEFYWGRENSSGDRHHSTCYPSCSSKCAPLLGFMLCGA